MIMPNPQIEHFRQSLERSAAMTDPADYHFELPPEARPPTYSPLAEQLHPSFGWLTDKRARARPRDVYASIDTVVVHATAGYRTQHAVDRWKEVKASAHWIVPDEDEPQHGEFVWATVAEAKAAFHVRDAIDSSPLLGHGPNVNNRSLGIEVVNTQDVQQFRDPFSSWQIAVTASIVLYAWSKYPNLRHVISHACLDPGRRKDPGPNFDWIAFREKVLGHEGLGQQHPLVAATNDSPAPANREGGCCVP